MSSVDYSKWKKIEVSDDEDDTHPNVDTPSLFRLRHQHRLEQMAELKQKKDKIECEKKQASARYQEIAAKLKDPSLDEKERMKMELEMQNIKQQEEEYKRKEKELEEQERLQPWNVDTIGHEAWSKSRINKTSEKKAEEEKKKPKAADTDEENFRKMQKYVEDNESLLQEFSALDGFDKTEVFLLEHPHLASEFATSWMTIEALNMAIEEEHDKMDKIAESCITVQFLQELAKSLNALATNTNVIKNFFKKIRLADSSYMQMHHDEVDAFKMRLRKRAKDKRDAAINKMEAAEKAERIAVSPGGLDPQEVLDSLPESMKEAFRVRSIPKMMDVAETMDSEVFQYHLNRCIQSGLWVPGASGDTEDKKDDADNVKDKAT